MTDVITLRVGEAGAVVDRVEFTIAYPDIAVADPDRGICLAPAQTDGVMAGTSLVPNNDVAGNWCKCKDNAGWSGGDGSPDADNACE